MTKFWTRRLTAQDHEIPQFSSLRAVSAPMCSEARNSIDSNRVSSIYRLVNVLGTLYSEEYCRRLRTEVGIRWLRSR